MILKLEGKRHFRGTSKNSGNNYDFTQIHVLMPQANVDGKAAVVKNIYDSGAYDRLIVGQYYDFQTDFDGNVVSFNPAKT